MSQVRSTMKPPEAPTNDVESTRRVGFVESAHVEFACFVDECTDNKRRIRYEVRINGFPSSASLSLEDDRSQPLLSDAEIEAACAYIRKFFREGLHDGMEIILREAIHKTHFRGGLTEKAFLKAVSGYIKDATEQRLSSDIAKRKRQSWRRFEATAKVRRDTAFFKEYRAEYKRLFREYLKTHRHNEAQFVKTVWRDHERQTFTGRTPKYLALALRVAQAPQGGLTPKEAALERVGQELGLSPETIDRHYVYARKKKPTKSI